MPGKGFKGFNDYEIEGDLTRIFIINREGVQFICLVDTEDIEKIKEFCPTLAIRHAINNNSDYARTVKHYRTEDGKYYGRVYEVQRVIMDVQFDNSVVVDHINHDTLDNRKENLRVAKRSENSKNRKSKNSNNTSGYRNVSWNSSINKWMVQLQIDGKNNCLGSFDNVHEAGKFAEEMREKLYKEFAGNK